MFRIILINAHTHTHYYMIGIFFRKCVLDNIRLLKAAAAINTIFTQFYVHNLIVASCGGVKKNSPQMNTLFFSKTTALPPGGHSNIHVFLRVYFGFGFS